MSDDAPPNGKVVSLEESAPQYAAAFSLRIAPNDVTLIALRHQPGRLEAPDGKVSDIGIPVPVASLVMSPHTFKDLYLLLSEQMKLQGDMFGKIVTEYERSKDKSKK